MDLITKILTFQAHNGISIQNQNWNQTIYEFSIEWNLLDVQEDILNVSSRSSSKIIINYALSILKWIK